MKREKTYYGPPRVILRLKRAKWKPFHTNGRNDTSDKKIFDGLEFFDAYIFRKPDKMHAIPCTLRVNKIGSKKTPFTVKGYVDDELAMRMKNGELCMLTHRRWYTRRNEDGEAVGRIKAREPLTSYFDGHRTDEYKVSITVHA